MGTYKVRRFMAVLLLLITIAAPLASAPLDLPSLESVLAPSDQSSPPELAALEVKGRAPKTGYARDQFGDGWQSISGCDTRNVILARDLRSVERDIESCKVLSGVLNDPYTGSLITFIRGPETSDDVQIDHIVALSNAWQTGAQQLSYEERVRLSNDPRNLLAVSGTANGQKSDGDAATWLPKNKSFRCTYVKKQVEVKLAYGLWVTPAERAAMSTVLQSC